jgi:hypothetical protein
MGPRDRIVGVAHEAPLQYEISIGIDRRQPSADRQIDDPCSVTVDQSGRYDAESLRALLAHCSECGFQITGRSRLHYMKLDLRAVTTATLTWASAARLGLMRTATRDNPGTVSFKSSNRLPARS